MNKVLVDICQMRKFVALIYCVLACTLTSWANFSKQSAYIALYRQATEIQLNDSIPITKTKYEIVFHFADEKAIALHHDYAIYYSFFDELQDVKVYTKNPQPNGKMKTIRMNDFASNNVSSSGIFYDDQKVMNIQFLGLTVGSEAHIEYTIKTKECHFTDPMAFRYYLPIEEVQFSLRVPTDVKIKILEKNIPSGFMTQSISKKKKYTDYFWTAKHVEEEKSYDDAPSRLYYTPHILYLLEEYALRDKWYSVAKSPADLFAWYIKNIRHITNKEVSSFKILADSITQGALSKKEKAKKVYDWVKTSIRYVAFENGMEGIIPRDAELVCSKKYGDCKDMSNLQVALLKSIDIPAHLAWVGTRSIPYTYSDVPLKNTDNHMIAAIQDNNEWIFLDATDPNGIFGLPTEHIQGKQAMVYLDNEHYTLVDIPVISYTINTIKDTFYLDIQKNNAAVQSTISFAGLLAGNMANQTYYRSVKEKEEYAKTFIKQYSNNAILQTNEMHFAPESNLFHLHNSFMLKEYAHEVDDELFCNLFLSKHFSNNLISDKNRVVPMSFKYNIQHQTTYILALPQGYHIDYLPENSSYKHEHFNYSIRFEQLANKIVCTQHIATSFPNLLLQKKDFNAWNTFVGKLQKAYKESIILQK
jgi:hypothetical protein